MKSSALLLVGLLVGLPSPILAGNIYGSLWIEGKPAQGAQIQIICSSPHPAQTDSSGSYRVYVPEKGRCEFRVDFAGRTAQATIASYDNPIKYDFDLVRQNDGNFVLRSK